MHRFTRAALCSLIAFAGTAQAQGNTYRACREAVADTFATLPGGAMLSIPGIGDDFVLTADGQFVERANGTAHLSALLRRASAFDRSFLLELELGGLTAPGAPVYPPLGALAGTLTGVAYVPFGPVNQQNYRFYTTGSGSLRGHGAYLGAQLSLTVAAPLQSGVGANDRNVQPGLGGTFAVGVLAQPQFELLVPTGAARLTATTSASSTICASHVDRDEAWSTGAVRSLLALPGVADDYLLIPAGTWTEASNGTATLQGTLKRPNDFEDRWTVVLTCSNRVDPSDASHPPANRSALGLVAAAYATQGGPIDPAMFRYYLSLAGTLTGEGRNAGGIVTLTNSKAVQVGMGADQGNLRYGMFAELAATVAHQPTARTIAVTGAPSVRANMDMLCILPYPQQTTGLQMTSDNVTDGGAMMTGIDLAWVDSMTIGANALISGTDPRNWVNGYLKALSNTQVEVHVPQALPLGTFVTRAFSPAGVAGARTIALTAPSLPRIRTQVERVVHEAQDWVMSQGNLQGPVLACMALSGSNSPSTIPGVIDLGIGAQFSSLITIPATFSMDPASGAFLAHVPEIPAVFQGLRLYCQAAVLELNNLAALPIRTTDVWYTDYR